MIQTAKNTTRFPQQVMFVDGSSIVVQPKEEIQLDMDNVFPEEVARLKMFFEFAKQNKKVVEPIRSVNNSSLKSSETKTGGMV